MDNKKYSKIYKPSDVKMHRNYGFRYNYEDSLLEYVSKYIIDFNNECKMVLTGDWEVITSIGLNSDSFKEDPQSWINQYYNDIIDECACMMDEFK